MSTQGTPFFIFIQQATNISINLINLIPINYLKGKSIKVTQKNRTKRKNSHES